MLLSKSNYLLGLQCPKLLWTKVNAKERMPPIDEAIQYRFNQGHIIGDMATKLFDGIKIPESDFMGNIRKTEKVLKLGKTLFEPGIMVDNLYSRADILRPVGDGWDIIEVKSTTRVKEQHITDLAFQKFVYEKKGLMINKCFLMHLNNQYVKQGEIDVKELFKIEDVTDDVKQISPTIEPNVKEMFAIISLPSPPNVELNRNCNSPYACPLTDDCWQLPKGNVFELYMDNVKGFELLENGIASLKDIPDDYKLTEKQGIQRECEKFKQIFVDKEKVKNWVSGLKYPLYFLDFETYNTAIPVYDGLRPYQRIPFQFSLHVIEKEGDTPKHISYLAENGDPRMTFLVSLQNVLGDKGTIVAYNMSFEKGVIAELAQMYPSFHSWAVDVSERFVDLIVPFRNFWYYSPRQQGSCSLKYVLPAVTGKSYEGMGINNGEAASLAFVNMMHGEVSDENVKQTRSDLEKYCGLDTEGMVWIIDELKKIVQ